MIGTGVTAIIPARAGSKGLPGKNLAKVGGRPLVLRACDAALNARNIDTVVVSSDWGDVHRIVISEYGPDRVRSLMRPTELATDSASVLDAIQHHINTGEIDPTVIVIVQPTCPLVNAADLEALVDWDPRLQMAMLVTESHSIMWTHAGHLLTQDTLNEPINRQQRDRQVREVGCYAWQRSVFDPRRKYPRAPAMVEIPAHRAVDIDSPVDLAVANALVGWGAETLV